MTNAKISLPFKARGAQETHEVEVPMLATYGALGIHENPYYKKPDEGPFNRHGAERYTVSHLPTRTSVIHGGNLASLKVQARVLDQVFSAHPDWTEGDSLAAARIPGLRDSIMSLRSERPKDRESTAKIIAQCLCCASKEKGLTGIRHLLFDYKLDGARGKDILGKSFDLAWKAYGELMEDNAEPYWTRFEDGTEKLVEASK